MTRKNGWDRRWEGEAGRRAAFRAQIENEIVVILAKKDEELDACHLTVYVAQSSRSLSLENAGVKRMCKEGEREEMDLSLPSRRVLQVMIQYQVHEALAPPPPTRPPRRARARFPSSQAARRRRRLPPDRSETRPSTW